MAKLAFLGLGTMGAPMAARLRAAGHDVAVWNRTRAKAETLAARGARVALSPAEAARGSEAAFTMLANPEALAEVLFGDEGLAAAMKPGTTWIDMSTVGPDAMRSNAARLAARVETLDAPVLGSVPQATDGTLAIFVGGARETFERWRPVLGVLGQPEYFGGLGSGAAMKLVANSTLGALMTALGEALALADAFGLDPKMVLDVLSQSPIGVTTRGKREHIESGTYPPRFTLSLACKDMQLITEAAGRAGRDLPVAKAARRWFEAASARGLAPLDYSAVIAQIRGLPARLPD